VLSTQGNAPPCDEALPQLADSEMDIWIHASPWPVFQAALRLSWWGSVTTTCDGDGDGFGRAATECDRYRQVMLDTAGDGILPVCSPLTTVQIR